MTWPDDICGTDPHQWPAEAREGLGGGAVAAAWTCELHRVTTNGDCPRCDDELIALAEGSARPACCKCGRTLAEGEDAWAEDWTVIADDYRSARRETRYTCEGCEATR